MSSADANLAAEIAQEEAAELARIRAQDAADAAFVAALVAKEEQEEQERRENSRHKNQRAVRDSQRTERQATESDALRRSGGMSAAVRESRREGGLGQSGHIAVDDIDNASSDVQCPVCGTMRANLAIERHVDLCLRGISDDKDNCENIADYADPSAVRHGPWVAGRAGSESSGVDVALLRELGILDDDEDPVPEGKMRCPMCFDDFDADAIENHAGACRVSGRRKPEKQELCPNCDLKMPASSLGRHVLLCSQTSKLWTRQEYEDERLAISLTRQGLDLTVEQHTALEFVSTKAAKMSAAAYPLLVKRFEGLGYKESNLQQTLLWIQNEAPIIIHVDLGVVLEHFVEDTTGHYRNQFETNTSRGTLDHSTRTMWEDRLFNCAYSKVKGFDRVKYGVLNIVNDPVGVRCCNQYGDSIIVLSHDVRFRCTFASKDSGYEDAELATTEHYCHVLADYDDNEIHSVVEVATGVRRCASSDRITLYKEAQIHGELRLGRDVEVVFANPRHQSEANVVALIQQFTEKFCRPVVWMEADY